MIPRYGSTVGREYVGREYVGRAWLNDSTRRDRVSEGPEHRPVRRCEPGKGIVDDPDYPAEPGKVTRDLSFDDPDQLETLTAAAFAPRRDGSGGDNPAPMTLAPAFAFLDEPRRPLVGSVHRRATAASTPSVRRGDLEALVAGSRGEPLPAELRARLARRLGELDDVRVHTDGAADAAARFLQADAFAIGRDIYFAAGKYDPSTIAGQRLVAHEVAHTAQHAGSHTGAELAVSSPGDAHEQQADEFADDFIAAGPREAPERPRVIGHDHEEAPRLVAPMRFAGISRHGPMPWRTPPSLPSTSSLTQIDVDPVELFPMDSFSKRWTLFDKKIPLARGVFPVGGVPVTYEADAGLSARSWLAAAYGPGRIEDIKVQLSAAERGAIAAAPDRPFLSLGPLGPFGPSIGIGPSPESVVRDRILASEHTASANARVSASASVGMTASATASGSVHALDIFGGGVYAGIGGGADARASASTGIGVTVTYKDGKVTVSNLTLDAEFKFEWNVNLSAHAGIFVELRMPNIPVISDLSHEVQDWPVIGWIVPDLTKMKWRKDFVKRWDLIKERGQRKWTKQWQIVTSGTNPTSPAMSLPNEDGYDFQAMIKEATEGKKPDADIPAEDAGPDRHLTDGASAGAVANTRQAAKAQVKSARDNIKRERAWNKQEIAKAVVKIAKAKAKQAKAGASPGGGAVQMASPSLAIGGGNGNGGGGDKLPEEQHKEEIEKRDEKLENADKGAENVSKKIDEVRGAAETAPDGLTRNHAQKGYEALGGNADQLGQAVGGYGGKADDFKRPVERAATGTADTAEAEKARLEARKVLDTVAEKVNEELIRADAQWREAVKVPSLKAFATKVDGYRADIRIQCERPLGKLETQQTNVPSHHQDDPAAQAHEYRKEIIPAAQTISAKLDELKPKAPEVPMAELNKAHGEVRRAVDEIKQIVNGGISWSTTEVREVTELLKTVPTEKRRPLAEHKAKVEEYSRNLTVFAPQVEGLDNELKGAEALMNDLTMRELVENEFKEVVTKTAALRPQVDAVKRPVRPKDEDTGAQVNTMVFQVQWNTKGGGPTFSSVRTGTEKRGVTVADAVSGLNEAVLQVKPEAARLAAEPARDKQIAWVRSHPATGGLTKQGTSWSEEFQYGGYHDARVDIENKRGHNLRE